MFDGEDRVRVRRWHELRPSAAGGLARVVAGDRPCGYVTRPRPRRPRLRRRCRRVRGPRRGAAGRRDEPPDERLPAGGTLLIRVVARRGGARESEHLIAWCAVEPDGTATGPDAACPCSPARRSKPLQALGSVRAGVLERFALGDRHLALACASHGGGGGARRRRRGDARARAACQEDGARLRARPPARPARARRGARGPRGSATTARASTRSAWRAACSRAGRWTATSAPGTRCRRAMRDCVAEACGVADDVVDEAVDGCGMRTFADAAVRRWRSPSAAWPGGTAAAVGRPLRGGACAPTPELVAYAGAIDTELMRAEPGARRQDRRRGRPRHRPARRARRWRSRSATARRGPSRPPRSRWRARCSACPRTWRRGWRPRRSATPAACSSARARGGGDRRGGGPGPRRRCALSGRAAGDARGRSPPRVRRSWRGDGFRPRPRRTRAHEVVRRPCRPARRSTSTSPSGVADRRAGAATAAASRRCCGSSPGWRSPDAGAVTWRRGPGARVPAAARARRRARPCRHRAGRRARAGRAGGGAGARRGAARRPRRSPPTSTRWPARSPTRSACSAAGPPRAATPPRARPAITCARSASTRQRMVPADSRAERRPAQNGRAGRVLTVPARVAAARRAR